MRKYKNCKIHQDFKKKWKNEYLWENLRTHFRNFDRNWYKKHIHWRKSQKIKLFFEIKLKMKRKYEKNPKNRNYKMLILHNFYEKTVKSKKCKFKAKKYERIWII